MRRYYCKTHRELFCCIWMCMIILGGCSGSLGKEEAPIQLESEEDKKAESESETLQTESITEVLSDEILLEPEMIEVDWSDYFDEMNGAAVVFDASKRQYMVYNSELALKRRSPCSTFKIISSLIALENGIIEPKHSTHTWSGEVFWNEKWNQDIAFEEAFRESCVWYFREVIDEIGQETMQEALNKLSYGNCDITDWQGRLNTNNNNPALTGFWLESSLLISPREQTEVMERIFGMDSVYSEETIKELKRVMQVTEAEIPIYGKTGMGKTDGVVVDAWFTGFAEVSEENTHKNLYYCVYLGRTDNKNVSSAAAKEIAIQILSYISRT